MIPPALPSDVQAQPEGTPEITFARQGGELTDKRDIDRQEPGGLARRKRLPYLADSGRPVIPVGHLIIIPILILFIA
jgi:hypothetical protein